MEEAMVMLSDAIITSNEEVEGLREDQIAKLEKDIEGFSIRYKDFKNL